MLLSNPADSYLFHDEPLNHLEQLSNIGKSKVIHFLTVSQRLQFIHLEILGPKVFSMWKEFHEFLIILL